MPVAIPLCTHIKTDGVRCGSPALRGKRFCYFHNRRPLPRRKPKALAAAFAALTDRQSLHDALTTTLQSLIAGDIDTKQAGVLLYALQTASAKLIP
jgi:hypothetical protein